MTIPTPALQREDQRFSFFLSFSFLLHARSFFIKKTEEKKKERWENGVCMCDPLLISVSIVPPANGTARPSNEKDI